MNLTNIIKFVSSFAIVALVSFMAIRQVENNMADKYALATADNAARGWNAHNSSFPIPPTAKVLRDLGRGWCIIELEGNKFLYRYKAMGNLSTEVMTPWVGN